VLIWENFIRMFWKRREQISRGNARRIREKVLGGTLTNEKKVAATRKGSNNFGKKEKTSRKGIGDK